MKKCCKYCDYYDNRHECLLDFDSNTSEFVVHLPEDLCENFSFCIDEYYKDHPRPIQLTIVFE